MIVAKAIIGGIITSYTYDKVGNRTKVEDYATATEYVYNELNQLVSSETYNKSPNNYISILCFKSSYRQY